MGQRRRSHRPLDALHLANKVHDADPVEFGRKNGQPVRWVPAISTETVEGRESSAAKKVAVRPITCFTVLRGTTESRHFCFPAAADEEATERPQKKKTRLTEPEAPT